MDKVRKLNSVNQQHRKNNYLQLPLIGLGTWEVTKKREINNAITAAFENNYKHIDTAQIYGNETQIGNKLISVKNKKRSSYFITTKIWPTNYKYHTLRSLGQSMNRLQTDYIDLVLLHMNSKPENNVIAYKELMKARTEKKIHFIGVSNFSIKNLKNLYRNVHEYPYANQVIASPIHRMKKLEAFCKKMQIKLIAYSTIRPYFNPNTFYGPNSALTDQQRIIIKKIAVRHKSTPAAIMLAWILTHNYYIIPKSTSETRIKENYHALDIKLSSNEIKKIDEMNHFTDEKFKKVMKTWEKRTDLPERKLVKGFLYEKYSYLLMINRLFMKWKNALKNCF